MYWVESHLLNQGIRQQITDSSTFNIPRQQDKETCHPFDTIHQWLLWTTPKNLLKLKQVAFPPCHTHRFAAMGLIYNCFKQAKPKTRTTSFTAPQVHRAYHWKVSYPNNMNGWKELGPPCLVSWRFVKPFSYRFIPITAGKGLKQEWFYICRKSTLSPFSMHYICTNTFKGRTQRSWLPGKISVSRYHGENSARPQPGRVCHGY